MYVIIFILAKDVTAIYVILVVTFSLQGLEETETLWKSAKTTWTDYPGKTCLNFLISSFLLIPKITFGLFIFCSKFLNLRYYTRSQLVHLQASKFELKMLEKS